MTTLKENSRYDDFGACLCNDSSRNSNDYSFGCESCSFLDNGDCWKDAVAVPSDNDHFTCWTLTSGKTVWK